MPFVPPKPIPVPHFRVELDSIGIANSVDLATGQPIDFRPTGRVNAGSQWTGRVTMTAPVEKEIEVRLISENSGLLPVQPSVRVKQGEIHSEDFRATAGSGPVGSSTGVIIAIYNAFFGPSTAAMEIEVLSLG